MAERLLFVIFTYSFHKIQTQALLAPTLTVNPPVINEMDSVTLNCQTPSSVPQCYFRIARGGSGKSFPCLHTLTGSNLLKMTHQSSPAEVKVTCSYLHTSQSPDSEVSSIIIRTLAPTLTVNPPVITEMDSVTLNCQTPSSVSVSQCYFYTLSGGTTRVLSCLQTLTGSDLLGMSQQRSPAEVGLKCFYTVQYGDINSPSPHSDTSTITIHSQRPQMSLQHFDGQKPQMSLQHFDGDYVLFTCSLPGSANGDTRCNLYFGEAVGPALTTPIWKKRTSTNQWFCQFTVTIDDLLRRLQFPQRSDASCDYSLGSEPNSLSPRSDGYSLTDIVERESSIASTKPAFTMTTDLTNSSPSASTTLVKPASDIVEKESRKTQTMPTSTMTTGLTASRLNASTTVTPAKQTSGLTAGSSNSGSFTSTSLKPVKPASETWTWKLAVLAACFGGGILLGLVLLCMRRRTERCSNKRTQTNVTDDIIGMTDLDHGGMLPAGNEVYSVITSVPAADCPTGSGKLKGQNEDSNIYHVYATISEEPPPSALKDMVYSTLQAY